MEISPSNPELFKKLDAADGLHDGIIQKDTLKKILHADAKGQVSREEIDKFAKANHLSAGDRQIIVDFLGSQDTQAWMVKVTVKDVEQLIQAAEREALDLFNRLTPQEARDLVEQLDGPSRQRLAIAQTAYGTIKNTQVANVVYWSLTPDMLLDVARSGATGTIVKALNVMTPDLRSQTLQRLFSAPVWTSDRIGASAQGDNADAGIRFGTQIQLLQSLADGAKDPDTKVYALKKGLELLDRLVDREEEDYLSDRATGISGHDAAKSDGGASGPLHQENRRRYDLLHKYWGDINAQTHERHGWFKRDQREITLAIGKLLASDPVGIVNFSSAHATDPNYNEQFLTKVAGAIVLPPPPARLLPSEKTKVWANPDAIAQLHHALDLCKSKLKPPDNFGKFNDKAKEATRWKSLQAAHAMGEIYGATVIAIKEAPKPTKLGLAWVFASLIGAAPPLKPVPKGAKDFVAEVLGDLVEEKGPPMAINLDEIRDFKNKGEQLVKESDAVYQKAGYIGDKAYALDQAFMSGVHLYEELEKTGG